MKTVCFLLLYELEMVNKNGRSSKGYKNYVQHLISSSFFYVLCHCLLVACFLSLSTTFLVVSVNSLIYMLIFLLVIRFFKTIIIISFLIIYKQWTCCVLCLFASSLWSCHLIKFSFGTDLLFFLGYKNEWD